LKITVQSVIFALRLYYLEKIPMKEVKAQVKVIISRDPSEILKLYEGPEGRHIV